MHEIKLVTTDCLGVSIDARCGVKSGEKAAGWIIDKK